MKNKRIILYFIASYTVFVSHLTAQISLDSTILDTHTVITGLDVPWEVTWGPDNYLWITERFGRVSRVNPETGDQTVIRDLSNEVFQAGESGLLGLALHPNFSSHPYVFLVYTYEESFSILERLVRYEYNGSSLINEMVLIDQIPGNTTHDGSRLLFLPDTTLLMTTGDAQNQSATQNLNNLRGKTLRLHVDGSIPSDNPFSGSYVWSFGHRNAQGLCLAPNGKVYSSEHGPTTDDEINLIEEGRNYGWPDVHGFCNSPNEQQFCQNNDVVEPLTAWTPTIATSDIIWYNHAHIPEFENTLLLTVLKDKMLVKLSFDNTGTVIIDEKEYFNNVWGRLRDICMAPDGRLFIATNGNSWSNTDPYTHSIIEIKAQGFVVNTKDEKSQSNDAVEVQYFLNDAINVRTSSGYLKQINVFDSLGRSAFASSGNGTGTFRFSVKQLKTGVYFLNAVDSENHTLERKIVVY